MTYHEIKALEDRINTQLMAPEPDLPALRAALREFKAAGMTMTATMYMALCEVKVKYAGTEREFV